MKHKKTTLKECVSNPKTLAIRLLPELLYVKSVKQVTDRIGATDTLTTELQAVSREGAIVTITYKRHDTDENNPIGGSRAKQITTLNQKPPFEFEDVL